MVKSTTKDGKTLAPAADRLAVLTRTVLHDLNAIGFNRPLDFIVDYQPARIRQALDLLASQPPGSVKNAAGWLRYTVMQDGDIPAPAARMVTGDRHEFTDRDLSYSTLDDLDTDDEYERRRKKIIRERLAKGRTA